MQEPSRRDGAKESGSRHPYHGTLLNTPFFYILLRPILPYLKPILALVYEVRWQLSRPFQIRILPKCFPLIDAPVLKSLPFVTLGQVVLALPLLILLIAGYYVSFRQADQYKSGNAASYALFAAFLTASKSNSMVTFVLGIPFERLVPYHNMSALTAVILSVFHIYVAYVYSKPTDISSMRVVHHVKFGDRHDHIYAEDSQYALHGSNPEFFKFLFDTNTNRTGSLLALAMVAMVATSLFPILRREFFDFWLWTHMALAVCVIIFALLHSVTLILMVAFWWAGDIVMRVIVCATCRYPSAAYLEKVSFDVVKISFPKPDNFEYNAGQFVQIAFADVNILAFHPLSIASAPHEPMVTLYARALGEWTEKVLALAEAKEEVRIMVEGPYGSISVDIEDDNRYQMAVCVSGGIGVTHCQSIAKYLLNEHELGRNLKQL